MAQARLAESRQERVILHHKAEASLETRNEEDDSNSRGDQSLLTEQEADGDPAHDRQASNQAGIHPPEEPTAATESMDARQQMQNRLYKSEMTKAASKFNLKPKNGLKYLTDKGYLVKEPKEEMIKGICKFLKETRALSPTAIG